MQTKNFKRDKNGYYIVKEKKLNELKKDFYTLKQKRTQYFIKNSVTFKDNEFQHLLACNNDLIMAEIVNAKVAKVFGLEAVDYHVATIGGDTIANLSEDFKRENPDAILLSEFFEKAGYYGKMDQTLQTYKSLSCVQNASTQFKESLDTAILYHFVTGQHDAHYRNMAKNNDNIIVFDSTECIPSRCEAERVKELYNNIRLFIPIRIGISEESAHISFFLDDLKTSPDISTEAIARFLKNCDNALKDDKCFVDIKAELKEEYNLPISNDYFDKLKYVMEKTGEWVDDAYTERVHSMTL